MPPTGDLAHNPGMGPDWESNQWPFGLQASTQPTEPHQPGLCFTSDALLPRAVWKPHRNSFLSMAPTYGEYPIRIRVAHIPILFEAQENFHPQLQQSPALSFQAFISLGLIYRAKSYQLDFSV